MRSSKTTSDRRGRDVLKVLGVLACGVVLGAGATTIPASATNLGATRSLAAQAIADQANSDVIEVRAGARRGGVAVGPRGGAVARRTTVVRPGFHGAGTRVVGPAVRPAAGWARPGWYRWPRGGAIAAGAAIGVVTAATAAAWAGAPPAPGMCWYYTDPSRTQGFWDYCR
jgi:hypothetical protein